jgi:hypothetical protein
VTTIRTCWISSPSPRNPFALDRRAAAGIQSAEQQFQREFGRYGGARYQRHPQPARMSRIGSVFKFAQQRRRE